MTSKEIGFSKENREIDDCKFCNNHGSDLKHFEDHGLDRLDLARLTESKTFYVIPDSLPVHPEGKHILLIPKVHVYGFAHLSDELDIEAQSQIDNLTEFLGGDVAIFEHGGIKNGGNVQSVYHAHAHMIAAAGKDVINVVKETLESQRLPWENVHPNHHTISTIRDSFKGSGYFFIQHNDSAIISHDPNDAFPSQMTQRTMSQLLTGQVVDWKRFGENPEFTQLSIERVSRVLSDYKNFSNGKL